ncbi:hypothetical protein ANANG_G00169450, partial [Anguilla anguilla]
MTPWSWASTCIWTGPPPESTALCCALLVRPEAAHPPSPVPRTSITFIQQMLIIRFARERQRIHPIYMG